LPVRGRSPSGGPRDRPESAILTGDITNFGDPPDAFRVVDAVRQFCPNVLAVTGNLDFV